MVSTQIVRNSLEELRSITKIEFCVQNPNGTLFAMTQGAVITDPAVISGFAQSAADSQIIGNSCSVRVMDEDETVLVLTASGNSDNTLMMARVAASETEKLVEAYKEKYDWTNFFQNLLLDNLLVADIAVKSRKLHIEYAEPRAVILLRIEADDTTEAKELLGGIFSERNGDYLTEVGEDGLALIKTVNGADDYKTLAEAAHVAVDMLNSEAMLKVRAAYGTIAGDLRSLSGSYKEAKMAIDVGQIFYAERRVVSYNELGIGRLIYQLPPNLCHIFIHEVFGDRVPDHLTSEELQTINAFLENSLNVSEASRKLFVHRNTLVYRIEKLQKETGLDIRVFDEAMTFKIALMVLSYLKFIDSRQ